MSQKSKKIVCHISLKDGVLDPQGVTIRNALAQLGFGEVVEVRSGKVFELTSRMMLVAMYAPDRKKSAARCWRTR